MDRKYIVYQSKGKQFGLSLLGLFMVLMSLFVLLAGLTEAHWLYTGIGIIGVLFFGWCEYFIIRQLIHGKELAVLLPEGFCDYSTAYATKDQLISWSQIKMITNQSIAGQSFVSVWLKEPEDFLSRLSTVQRTAISANRKLGFGEINISLQSAKHCTNDQLIEKMNQFMEEYNANQTQ